MNLFRQLLSEHGYAERPGVTWDPPEGTPEGALRLQKRPAMEHLLRHHTLPSAAFALEKVRRSPFFLDCNFIDFGAWVNWHLLHGERDAQLLGIHRNDEDFAETQACELLDTSFPDWLVVDWTQTALALTEGVARVPLDGGQTAYFKPR